MINSRTRLIAISAVLLGLAACQPTTIDPNKEDQEARQAAVEAAKKAPPLPMIGSSKIYRCDDSSVVRADFMTDGVTANVKIGDAPAKPLIAPEKGQPFTAEGGYSLDGSGNTVKLASPGHKSQSCHTG